MHLFFKQYKKYGVMLLILLLLGILLVLRPWAYFAEKKAQGSASQTFLAMDTVMKIDVYGPAAEKNAAAVQELIVSLENILAVEQENSELAKLNRGEINTVSANVLELLRKSIELHQETGGAFDCTIYPVKTLWGFGEEEKHVPTKEEIASRLGLVDSSKINLDETTGEVSLPQGMMVDFGGIAKGYTSDLAKKCLEDNGIQSAMLNLGGNVSLLGTKPNGAPWKIGITHPKDTSRVLGVVSASDCSIITSGGYERNFTVDGNTYHHILDPSTGYPAESGLLSVTIVSADGALGDGLSTALYVMGKEKAIEYWRKNSDSFDFILYTEADDVLVSEGLENAFTSELSVTIVRQSPEE